MKPAVKTIITITTTAAVTFAGTSALFVLSGDGGSSVGSDSMSRKLGTVNAYIRNNYLYEDYNMDEMGEAAVKAYVEALDEPYTHYYTPDEFASYMSAIEESYVGIGVVISADEEAGKIIVIAPTEGSPAYNAGIMPGDYITAVDGQPFSGDEMNECVSAIKGGPAGSSVRITIERGGQSMDFDINREEIVTESVKSEMLDGNIGYIRITGFNASEQGSDENTFTEFEEQAEALKSQGMQKLIIDLRDNPGGVLDIACDIADYLLPEGIITYTETRSGEREEYYSDEAELDMPIAVLINGNSASASEVLVGALKDYGKAEVIGEKSYGKGIVQAVYPFYDGSGMSMTIAKYYSPNGVCIHGVGIEPDVAVSVPEEYAGYYASDIPREADTQLNKAIEMLND